MTHPDLPGTIRISWRKDGVVVFYPEKGEPHMATMKSAATDMIRESASDLYNVTMPCDKKTVRRKPSLTQFVSMRWTKRDNMLRFYSPKRGGPKYEVPQDEQTDLLLSVISAEYSKARPLAELTIEIAGRGKEPEPEPDKPLSEEDIAAHKNADDFMAAMKKRDEDDS